MIKKFTFFMCFLLGTFLSFVLFVYGYQNKIITESKYSVVDIYMKDEYAFSDSLSIDNEDYAFVTEYVDDYGYISFSDESFVFNNSILMIGECYNLILYIDEDVKINLLDNVNNFLYLEIDGIIYEISLYESESKINTDLLYFTSNELYDGDTLELINGVLEEDTTIKYNNTGRLLKSIYLTDVGQITISVDIDDEKYYYIDEISDRINSFFYNISTTNNSSLFIDDIELDMYEIEYISDGYIQYLDGSFMFASSFSQSNFNLLYTTEADGWLYSSSISSYDGYKISAKYVDGVKYTRFLI